jgi:myo-inositol catabolism protein IolC
MKLGYDKPLYLMAFDHRSSFERDLFAASPPVSDKVRAGIMDAKEVIYEGFVEAVGRGVPVAAAGVLVDEEYGASVARKARSAGYVLAMPVEESGQAEFQFQYGDDFGRHIEEFDPAFSKVLVRYNPDGDRELNRRQSARLARLSGWLHDRNRRFLFELLIPPTPEQLGRAGGDQRRYDREIRPDLEVRVIHALQDAGVEPDIWKIEGLDSTEACVQVVAAAHRGGRDGVRCVVLGRGADEAQVLEWLRIAAPVPGFDGFAVGRTNWEQPLRDMIAGTIPRSDAVHQIADHYVENVTGYRLATGLTGLTLEEPWPRHPSD